jgi:hypothetical protein
MSVMRAQGMEATFLTGITTLMGQGCHSAAVAPRSRRRFGIFSDAEDEWEEIW